MVPSDLGLGTEVRLWSHFHILFNWRITNLSAASVFLLLCFIEVTLQKNCFF